MAGNEKNTQPTGKELRRSRVIAALNHRESDRIPLTLGSPSCSLHNNAQKNLMGQLGFTSKTEPTITDHILQIVEPDQKLLDYFDIDLLWLLPKEAPVEWEIPGQIFIDEFGRKFKAGGGFFNQVNFPLKKQSLEELSRYNFPDLTRHKRFGNLKAQAKSLYRQGFGLGIDGPWGIYEISSSLAGVSEYLMSLALNPEYAGKLAEKVLENHHIPFYSQLLAETSDFVQIVGISDDLGAQNGLIFSRKTFQKIFKPLLRQLVEHIHKISSAKVYMHSDGSIYPIIPDLIEIGVEGLNPVQYTAKDMELEKLKSEFGKDLGFFGGVVENSVLSFSSPLEIKKLVKQNVEILKKGGGFIFAPIHNISQEVPPENIIALYQAGHEFGVCDHSE